MGDSYREELQRKRKGKSRPGISSVGFERAAPSIEQSAAVQEARRKEKARQLKLW